MKIKCQFMCWGSRIGKISILCPENMILGPLGLSFVLKSPIFRESGVDQIFV